jgi:hypothetical protein
MKNAQDVYIYIYIFIYVEKKRAKRTQIKCILKNSGSSVND